MTPDFLSRLVRQAIADHTGCVPRDDRWFEPLAAVYPRICLPLAEDCLHAANRSMQHFVRLAVKGGLVGIHELQPGEPSLFKNLNQPGDL